MIEGVTAMETYRCPTCLFVLIEPNPTRCPACHKRLTGRRRPIVLGDRTKFATHPLDLDLVRLERVEHVETSENKVHTPISEPSQLDPELREMLDDLHRKARADLDEGS